MQIEQLEVESASDVLGPVKPGPGRLQGFGISSFERLSQLFQAVNTSLEIVFQPFDSLTLPA